MTVEARGGGLLRSPLPAFVFEGSTEGATAATGLLGRAGAVAASACADDRNHTEATGEGSFQCGRKVIPRPLTRVPQPQWGMQRASWIRRAA